MSQYVEQLKKLRAQIPGLTAEVKTLLLTKTKLEKHNLVLQKESSDLVKRADVAQKELVSLEDKKKQTAGAIATLEKKLPELTKAKEQAELYVTVAREEAESIVTKAKDDAQAIVARANTRRTLLDEQTDKQNMQYNHMQVQVQNLESQVQHLVKKKASVSASVDASVLHETRLREETLAMEAGLVRMREDFAELEKKTTQRKEALKNAEKKLKETESMADSAQKQAQVAKKELETYTDMLKEKEREYERSVQEIAALADEQEALREITNLLN